MNSSEASTKEEIGLDCCFEGAVKEENLMDWELLDVASFSFESEDEEESVGEDQLEAPAVIDLFHASLYCNQWVVKVFPQ